MAANKAPKAVTEIPSTVTEINLNTGKETHTPAGWKVLPPAPHKCQICAVEHSPEDPHDAFSIYYQMTFNGIVGRMPTWADALAHCDEEIKFDWETELRKKGAWSQPPDDEVPVRHHGVE